MKKLMLFLVVITIVFMFGCLGEHIFWSPDSRYFISVSHSESGPEIVKVDITSNTLERINVGNNGGDPFYVQLTPNLDLMAVTFAEDDTTTVSIFKRESDKSYKKTDTFKGYVFHPSAKWSPSGNRLILSKDKLKESGEIILYIYNADDSSVKKIAQFRHIDDDSAFQCFWVSDNEIAFLAEVEKSRTHTTINNEDKAICALLNLDNNTSRVLTRNLIINEETLLYDCAAAIPGTRDIIFAENNYLKIVNIETGETRRKNPMETVYDPAVREYDSIYSLSLDPQTGRLYFSASNSKQNVSNIFSCDLNTWNASQHTFFEKNCHVYGMSVSPDGTKKVCVFDSNNKKGFMFYKNDKFTKLYSLDSRTKEQFNNRLIETTQKYEDIKQASEKRIQILNNMNEVISKK